ncbi:MAG: cob(I)yrinic acid a,c-diamide adenosyltransferase [Thermodesulfovibrionales bacterium]
MTEEFKGLIQVYTGNGKGKTTAALGLCIRAAGWGYRSYIGQFMKGQKYGEIISLKRFDGIIEIEQFGKKGFIHVEKGPDEEDIRRARDGMRKCLLKMNSRIYKIIVLDEINIAMYFGLITEGEIHNFLDQKPYDVEVVLTGRYAPQSIIERADLVTEMREVKHYFHKGIVARKGIEK